MVTTPRATPTTVHMPMVTTPTGDPTAIPMPTVNPTPVPDDGDPDNPVDPDNPIFYDAHADLLPYEGHFFDPSDGTTDFGFIG